MEEYLFENWKPIEGFNVIYEVSDWGSVRNGKKLLRQRKLGNYMIVQLKQDLGWKTFLVHRLVCQAFNENPDNLNIVNHKTECPCFNHFSNLEWCTQSYNNTYNNVHIKKGLKHRNNNQCKPVFQYDLNGCFIRKWSSCCEVKRELGFDTGHISACCLGKQSVSHGFQWRYSFSDKIEPYVKQQDPRSKSICQYTLAGELVKKWESARSIEYELGYSRANITKCCNGVGYYHTAYGYKWKWGD